MRAFALVLSALLLVPPALLAQQGAGQNPPLDPANSELDRILLEWEKAMGGIDSLAAECKRTAVDKVFQTKETFEGSAKYLKTQGDNFASLEMHNKTRPGVYEKYLFTGTFLYQYIPQQKIVQVHALPKPKEGQVADNNIISFLFGMKAAQAKLRYQMTTQQPDQWYYYIYIQPRSKEDRAEFQRARLVLWRKNFLPCQLWFEEPNGNEIIWDFPRVQTNAPLRAQDFAPPRELPTGWRFVQAPVNQGPPQMRNPR